MDPVRRSAADRRFAREGFFEAQLIENIFRYFGRYLLHLFQGQLLQLSAAIHPHQNELADMAVGGPERHAFFDQIIGELGRVQVAAGSRLARALLVDHRVLDGGAAFWVAVHQHYHIEAVINGYKIYRANT